MSERELEYWDERGKHLFEYLHDDKVKPVTRSFEAQQDFLAEELRKCQQNMVRDEKELNAFKDRLRTDEEEIARLGSSARAAMLNLGRDATPEEVIAAIEEIETKIRSFIQKSQHSEREMREEFAKAEAA